MEKSTLFINLIDLIPCFGVTKIKLYIISKILEKIDNFHKHGFTEESLCLDFFIKSLKERNNDNAATTSFCTDFNEDDDHCCWMCFSDFITFYISTNSNELYDDIYANNERNKLAEKLSINLESAYASTIESSLLRILECIKSFSEVVGYYHIKHIYDAVNYKEYINYKEEDKK